MHRTALEFAKSDETLSSVLSLIEGQNWSNKKLTETAKNLVFMAVRAFAGLYDAEHDPSKTVAVCPFCAFDPYEYVDIGVGLQPVAVTCCSLGQAYFTGGSKDDVTLSRAEFDDIAQTLLTFRGTPNAATWSLIRKQSAFHIDEILHCESARRSGGPTSEDLTNLDEALGNAVHHAALLQETMEMLYPPAPKPAQA